MHTAAPPLLPLFRSAHQGQLLACVLLDPAAEHSLTDLARRLQVHHATVSREVDRLEAAGLVRTRRLGPVRLVRADPTSPVLPEVRALALKTFGPAYVLAHALAGVAGIEAAWLYGSWAERATGIPGPSPQDLDVLVIGTPDRTAVFRAAHAAQERLGREVNAVVRTPAEWADAPDGFLATVRAGPRVPIPLDAGR